VVTEKLSNTKLGERVGHKSEPSADELVEPAGTDPLANAAKRPPGSTF
jgi:hypothetical protein